MVTLDGDTGQPDGGWDVCWRGHCSVRWSQPAFQQRGSARRLGSGFHARDFGRDGCGLVYLVAGVCTQSPLYILFAGSCLRAGHHGCRLVLAPGRFQLEDLVARWFRGFGGADRWTAF